MRKKIIKLGIALGVLGLVLLFLGNYLVKDSSKGKTYNNVNLLEKRKVGLVLGTAKNLRNGSRNLYFDYRIDAVLELYQQGKIEYILVSGDNGRKGYDEPTDFKDELIKRGIPVDKIVLDYAGFRTLDSVVRAKEVFGQSSVIVISQKFHNERAIYLAQKKGIDAIGYNARDVSGRYGLRVKAREYLARTKAFLDVLLQVKPKYLGSKVVIG